MKYKVKRPTGFKEFESKLDDRQAAVAFTVRLQQAKENPSEFMSSLYSQVRNRGINGISEAQRAWVHYFAGRHDVAEEVGKMPVEVDGTLIKKFFDEVQAKGSKPVVHIRVEGRDIKLSPAKESSKNPGCIYIAAGPDYLGKITPDGKYMPTKLLFDGLAEALVEFCKSPKEYAVKYGKITGRCCFCGLVLETRASIWNGFGPVCSEKWGLDYGQPSDGWTPGVATETPSE
jgi:hypothetical protein